MGIYHIVDGLTICIGYLPPFACLDRFVQYSLRGYELIYYHIELTLSGIINFVISRSKFFFCYISAYLVLILWNLEECDYYKCCISNGICDPVNGPNRTYVRGVTGHSAYNMWLVCDFCMALC